MYGGLSSAILSPAEATGAVAVSSAAEPSAPASPTSRYLLDDFSKVQQTAQVQQQQFAVANGGGGGNRKRQAYYEARRQPDKSDYTSNFGKRERKRERKSARVI